MKIQLSSPDVLDARTDCLVVGVRENAQQPQSTRKIDRAAKGLIGSLMRSGDIDGRPGSALMVPSPAGIEAKRLLLVGVGDKPDVDDFANAARAAARQLCSSRSVSAVVALTEIAVSGADPRARARIHERARRGRHRSATDRASMATEDRWGLYSPQAEHRLISTMGLSYSGKLSDE